jgi:hypothetical protein
MLGNWDQMLKGARFIWYYWSQALEAHLEENEEYFEFKGKTACFRYLDGKIIHERIIRKWKNKPEWEIMDVIHNKPDNEAMKQLWHSPLDDKLIFDSQARLKKEKSLYSSYYGQKEFVNQFVFTADAKENTIKTTIAIIV